MESYLCDIKNVEAFLAGMDSRVRYVDKKYDLEGPETNFTARRKDLRVDLLREKNPRLQKAQTWIDMIPDRVADSIIPGAGVDWVNGVTEKRLRMGLAILAMLENHCANAETMAGLIRPDGQGNATHISRWTTVLRNSHQMTTVNATFLSTCGALALRVMKSPEYATLKPLDRDNQNVMMSLFHEYTNCKLILGAVMYPWKHVLHLNFLIGPRATTVESMRIQDSVLAWLHGKVTIGMWMVYSTVFNQALPPDSITPLKPAKGWEAGLYRPWKGMIGEEPLKSLLGPLRFEEFPVRIYPSVKEKEVLMPMEEKYQTWSIVEILGPARLPL